MKILKHYRFLLLRRTIQLGLLFLYFMANYAGWKLLSGNLSASEVLGVIPLSDPLAILQLFLAGGALGANALLGAFIIAAFYALFAGRAFCAYVCPMNLITDSANSLRRLLGIDTLQRRLLLRRHARYWVLGMTLLLSLVLGLPAFEFISPIGILHRGIIFGMGMGGAAILIVFLFDLLAVKNGFCGHLCPLGAFYSLIGRYSLLRVKYQKESCTLCMKCKEVCPEKQVLNLIGKQSGYVLSGECLNCGRCIEVCEGNSLGFSIRSLIELKKDEKDEKHENIKA